MTNWWHELAAACWHEDPAVSAMRTEYALTSSHRIIFDHTLQQIRSHIGTFAVWNAGRIDPDRLTDSLVDHLRDVTVLPIDAAIEEELA
jgi:hypothetical protein